MQYTDKAPNAHRVILDKMQRAARESLQMARSTFTVDVPASTAEAACTRFLRGPLGIGYTREDIRFFGPIMRGGRQERAGRDGMPMWRLTVIDRESA